MTTSKLMISYFISFYCKVLVYALHYIILLNYAVNWHSSSRNHINVFSSVALLFAKKWYFLLFFIENLLQNCVGVDKRVINDINETWVIWGEGGDIGYFWYKYFGGFEIFWLVCHFRSNLWSFRLFWLFKGVVF